jgi:predicted transcriptional regulator
MTAKEALRAYIDDLPEAGAELLLRQLETASNVERPLTQFEIALIERGIRDADSGDLIGQDEIERELALECPSEPED